MDPVMLSQVLLSTLSPHQAEIKRAEAELKNAKRIPGFALSVLQLCKNPPNGNLDVAKAAAICFKNFVKWNWDPKGSADAGLTPDTEISPQEKHSIKEGMVDFMCTVHPSVQRQLSDSVRIIAEHDWPGQWESLLPGLVQRLMTPNQPLPVLVGVLSTTNELFKRFRNVAKTDEILTIEQIALQGCQAELLQFFSGMLVPATLACVDPIQGEQLYTAVRLCCRIFFSLNWLDIPEFFEDNIITWMSEFQKFLDIQQTPFAKYDDEENPSPLDRVQSAVFQNLSLYVEKYAFVFEKYLDLKPYIMSAYGLLVKSSSSPMVRYDEMVFNGMKFLSTAAASAQNVALFGSQDTLGRMLEQIVIPNLSIRAYDIEAFEDNPIEYLRRDIEGSDAETRRRIAREMIEKLCHHFDDAVTDLCAKYIQHLLSQSASGGSAAWKAKDVAINLVLAISVRGSTQREGATKLKDLNSVLAFLVSTVLPELQSQSSGHLILKADAIKYIAVLRQFMPKAETLSTIFPLLLASLESKSVVVHTYAAAAIDGILGVREPEVPGQNFRDSRYKRADIANFAQPVLLKLFALIDAGGVQYNEYLMKCVVRVVNVSREDVGPAVPQILKKLGEITWRVAENPSNPVFNHFLFESIAALVKFGFESRRCTVTDLEAALLPSFGFILEKNISEFVPYVLQIMAQTLMMRNQGAELSAHHQVLFPIVMGSAIWEDRASVPALVMLLEGYLTRSPQLFNSDEQVLMLFTTFSKLLAYKSTEDLSFEVMRCVVTYLPMERLGGKLTEVFQASLMKYTQTKSVVLAKAFVTFIGVFVGKKGPAACAHYCEALQPGMFIKVLTQIVVPTLPKISEPISKKVVAVGLTRVLCEYQMPKEAWDVLCEAQVRLLGGKLNDNSSALEEQRAQINDALEQMAEAGHAGSFSRLSFARDEAALDFFPEVKDIQAYFISHITAQSALGNQALAALHDPTLATMFKMWAGGRS